MHGAPPSRPTLGPRRRSRLARLGKSRAACGALASCVNLASRRVTIPPRRGPPPPPGKRPPVGAGLASCVNLAPPRVTIPPRRGPRRSASDDLPRVCRRCLDRPSPRTPDGFNPNEPMTILSLLAPSVSLVLLAAHFYRAGYELGILVSLLALVLIFRRRPLAARSMQR